MNRRTLILAAIPLALAGCAADRGSGPFAEWIDHEPVESPALVDEGGPSPAHSDRPEPDISDGAGVEDFVRLALERNPSIRAAEHRVRRLANRIPQVTSLDDPMLELAPVGEMAETAAGQVGVMAGVSQRLPLPAKLDVRGRIAEQEVAEAVRELEEARLDVAADTRLAWWSHYYATRAIEVTRRNRVLVSQFRDVAEAKFRAGVAAQEDVLRASLELHSLDTELIELDQRRVSARAMLNRLIDRRVEAPIPEPPAQSIESIEARLDPLQRQAVERHPALARIRERIEGFRRRHALARLDRWPDLTVSANYNLVDSEGLSPVANGDDQWWIGFGINLPIWTARLDAAEREALRGRLEQVAVLDDAINRIEFRVRDALANVESHQRQAVLFRDVIVPQAELAVDASLSSYRAGKVEFLTLIDNWRKLLTFELTYHHHLAELERSFAELQRAAGRNLPRAPEPDGDETDSEEP